MTPIDVLIMCAAIGVYFLPAFVASARGHQNASAIFVLNLFLGWTFLGWIGALVWSMTYSPTRPENLWETYS